MQLFKNSRFYVNTKSGDRLEPPGQLAGFRVKAASGGLGPAPCERPRPSNSGRTHSLQVPAASSVDWESLCSLASSPPFSDVFSGLSWIR